MLTNFSCTAPPEPIPGQHFRPPQCHVCICPDGSRHTYNNAPVICSPKQPGSSTHLPPPHTPPTSSAFTHPGSSTGTHKTSIPWTFKPPPNTIHHTIPTHHTSHHTSTIPIHTTPTHRPPPHTSPSHTTSHSPTTTAWPFPPGWSPTSA